jgi:uncharacterized protein YegP (UPF0339 family)
MSYIGHRLLASLLLSLAVSACAGDVSDHDEVSGGASEVAVRGRFDLYRAQDDQFYFTFESGQGEILLYSEGYEGRTGALNGILSVLENGAATSRYAVRQGEDGLSYAHLRAGNGHIIASSQGFVSTDEAYEVVAGASGAVVSYNDHWSSRTGARFEVFGGTDGRYYFRLYAGNGEQVLRSQGYASEASALNGAFAVAEYGVDAKAFVVTQNASGGYYFNVRAPNNEIIATSETYSTGSNAERARDSIIALLPKVELL